MIRNTKGKLAEAILGKAHAKGVSGEWRQAAFRKLLLINQAVSLDDLRSPPGNHLEALNGDRAGQYSIRINKQYRICFRWEGMDACDVEIVDYH